MIKNNLATNNPNHDTFSEILKKYKDKVTKTETSALKFLMELGVLIKNGNITKNIDKIYYNFIYN